MNKKLFPSIAFGLLGVIVAGGAISSCVKSVAGGDDKDNVEARIEALLSQMTIEEKIGQLNQLTGTGANPQRLAEVRNGFVGSLLNEVDPDTVNKLQREAVENSRLGIPLIVARDVIHGFKTIFPIPLGQASSWDPALIEEGARVAADEASSVGVRWTFSPMVDVSRDARWGRIAESFGEDPYLASTLGVAMVKGYQGEDMTQPNTMAACVKHFVGYGASEGGKDYNTTWIPEPHLRDVYLPPFHACADAGAATFMCSFNDINGMPTNADTHLMRDILRDEWGWDGVMCSDWNSIGQLVPQGYSADLKDAAEAAAKAGVDVDMMSYAYVSHMKDLVEQGKVSEKTLDDLVRNVLRLKFRLGLFENPYVDTANARRFYTEGNLAAAQHAAEQSAILLKNEGGVLPLKPGVRVALTGPMMDAKHDQNGTWSFDAEKEHTVTVLDAFNDMYGKDKVVAAPGLTYSRDTDKAGIAQAVVKARTADVIVFVCGEEAVLSGEAHCRTDLTLPGAQKEMLKALKATGKPVVSVVMTGRPMEINDVVANSDAILYCFHPGTMGGPAIANVLSGSVNPSGHLPAGIPRASAQAPLYYSHKNTGRPAEGMVLMDELPQEAGQTSTGCTSFYMDCGDGALYPFGYGLSYTDFSYGPVVLSTDKMDAKDGSIRATCEIENTGSVKGATVAQLYVRDVVGSLCRPVKELKGFEKIELAPGEKRTVSFTLTPDDLAFHNARSERVTEPGEFRVWIAQDSASGESKSFTVE
ncbi:MAG: beta-glucosidase BglX [Muribaculaceae bacterium]|nr:beta-glucosidase BglX [Muribaculaceae bacterium]